MPRALSQTASMSWRKYIRNKRDKNKSEKEKKISAKIQEVSGKLDTREPMDLLSPLCEVKFDDLHRRVREEGKLDDLRNTAASKQYA